MARWDDEILTDNTKINYCPQCRDCANWGHTDSFGNAPEKSNCDKYPYPDMKPIEVIDGSGKCPNYKKKS